MLNSEYKSWLKKQIEKADKAEKSADESYQLLGMQRYANARDNAEYLGRALRTALTIEEGRDERHDKTRRALKGLRDTAMGYAASMDPDEALQKVIGDLNTASLFGW